MTEFLASILQQTAALCAPIPGASPSGADLALEPEFEAIKGEIDKLSSLSGGSVDWRQVVRGAEDLLSNRTKDLRLAFWMAAGEVTRSGWTGFARSLVVCRALVTDFWSTMYPVRPKGRANIAAWFGERVNPQLVELKVDLESGDAVRACAELLTEIDGVFSEKLGDAYSGMGSVRNTMRLRVKDIPLPPPPPPTPPPPQEASPEWADDDDDVSVSIDNDDDDAGGASSASSSSSEEDDDAPAQSVPAGGVSLSTRSEDASATVAVCSETLIKLARAMVQADAPRAWAYRLHRAALWLPLETPSSRLAGPGDELRGRLSSLLASGRWGELLQAAEEASSLAPLWLDAQRYAALAMERLGLAFVEAREVVGRDASDLVRRWPDIVEALFEDGTPLADPETRDWLREEAVRWQLVVSRAADVARDEDAELKRRFHEARDLVGRGRSTEGLALAMQLARRGGDTRARFRASLRVAELAMRVGAYEVALPILDGLFATAEAHSLEAWEPGLCASFYVALVTCLQAEAGEAALERRNKVFERLCRLDPGAALRTRPGGGQGGMIRPSLPSLPSQPSQPGRASGSPSFSAPPLPSSRAVEPEPEESSSAYSDDDDD